jgi:hypothetical protein
VQGDRAGARVAADRAGRLLDELLSRRPHDWQGDELRARLALVDLAAGGADPARCERHVKALQPAVDSGQAGIVLEAWLRARDCAGLDVDRALRERLTAGGYVAPAPISPQPNRAQAK